MAWRRADQSVTINGINLVEAICYAVIQLRNDYPSIYSKVEISGVVVLLFRFPWTWRQIADPRSGSTVGCDPVKFPMQH